MLRVGRRRTGDLSKDDSSCGIGHPSFDAARLLVYVSPRSADGRRDGAPGDAEGGRAAAMGPDVLRMAAILGAASVCTPAAASALDTGGLSDSVRKPLLEMDWGQCLVVCLSQSRISCRAGWPAMTHASIMCHAPSRTWSFPSSSPAPTRSLRAAPSTTPVSLLLLFGVHRRRRRAFAAL